jgi:hypothetical protein
VPHIRMINIKMIKREKCAEAVFISVTVRCKHNGNYLLAYCI